MNKNNLIVFVTNYIPIYRTPIYKYLSDKNFNFSILTSSPKSKSDSEAIRALPIKEIRGFNIKQKIKFNELNSEQEENVSIPLSLFYHLIKLNPRIIVSSEFGIRSLICMIYAKASKKVFILSSEEICTSAKAIGISRKLIRKLLFSQANAFLAWGLPAKQYLINNSIDESMIYLCAQAVDNMHWRNNSAKSNRSELRDKHNIKGKLFLAAGRLVKRKGFDLLINAWAALPYKTKSENSLMLIGDGPEKEYILDLVKRKSIMNFIHIEWRSYDELPAYYGIADIFVFPSLIDVWGLVVNEAMASGLPVLASRFAGSSQQLINSDNVGTLIDPTNQQEFTSIINKWALKAGTHPSTHPYNAISEINFEVSFKAIEKMLSMQLA